MDTIACCRCTTTFKSFHQSQADGCAATIHAEGIYGSYGSNVADMSHFVFTDPATQASLPENGQICDGCLLVLIEAGQLRKQPVDQAAIIAAAQEHINARFNLDKLVPIDPSVWEEVGP